MKFSIATLAAIAILVVNALGQTAVTRQPYLHMGTETSVTVRWRTDSTMPTVDSKVWYGTVLDTALMTKAFEATLTSEHEINIAGLVANTKYFYAIGTSTELLQNLDSTYYFQTSPPLGTKQPIRIWAIGDFGEGNAGAPNIKTGYLSYLNGRHTDAWIWLGDNAYDDGRDEDYQTNVFDVYADVFKNHILYPSPGNHDYGQTHPVISLGAGPYYANFTMPTYGECGGTPSGTEAYYSYDYGNVHFISLNSEEYDYTLNLDLTLTIEHDPAMITWLQNDLAANTNKDWIIAYLHQPPYSRGTHTETNASIGYYDGAIMRAVRDNIIPILENSGVDLVLNGHSHAYERSYLIHGNYGPESPYPIDSTIVDGGTGSTSDGTPYKKFSVGPNANKGTVYAVVGCSAKTGNLLSDGQLDHPLMYAGGYEGGSMVIEINNNQLDAFLIDSLGNVYDDFTIIKDGSAPQGLAEPEKQIDQVVVYPNPFAGELTVEFTLNKSVYISLDIVDLSGKKVYTIVQGNQVAGKHKYTVDSQNTGLVAGAYLLQFKTEGVLIVQKTIRL